MSDFKAKIHQIHFLLRLRPRPPIGGTWSAPLDPLAVFKRPSSSKWRAGNGTEGEREGEEKVKGEERGEEVKGGIWPTQKFWHGARYAPET